EAWPNLEPRGNSESGEIQRTQMQAGATGRYRPLPEKRASFARLEVQARHEAGSARRAVGRTHVRLWITAPRKAEAASHLWRARAAVRAVLRRGNQGQELDGHQPAPASRVAARQRRLPDGVRVDSPRSAAARFA